MMTYFTQKQIEASIALYSKLFLVMYDFLALGLIAHNIWKCPSHNMLELYNRYISANHLDIGVGTGYFMDKCVFPSIQPRLVLMDLNQNSLQIANRRLRRYRPIVYQHNALEPLNIALEPFDSVGIMNLLHCLPGNMDTKSTIFRNIRPIMNSKAVVFGSTLLYQGVKLGRLASLILECSNNIGFMNNINDDAEGLNEILKTYFKESSVEIVGCMILFWGRIKK